MARLWTPRKSPLLRATAKRFLKNPVATSFLDAQEEMHEIESSIKKTVSKAIELGRIPLAADLEEGSCGHGCGCHH